MEFFRNEERVHLRDEEDELFPLLLRYVRRSLLPSARHASNTCSSRSSRSASSALPWQPASSIERRWMRRESCLTHTSGEATALSADRATRGRRRAPEAEARRRGRDLRRSAPAPHELVVAELWRKPMSHSLRWGAARTQAFQARRRVERHDKRGDLRPTSPERMIGRRRPSGRHANPRCPQAGRRLPDLRAEDAMRRPSRGRAGKARDSGTLPEPGVEPMISASTPGCVASQAPRQVRIWSSACGSVGAPARSTCIVSQLASVLMQPQSRKSHGGRR